MYKISMCESHNINYTGHPLRLNMRSRGYSSARADAYGQPCNAGFCLIKLFLVVSKSLVSDKGKVCTCFH